MSKSLYKIDKYVCDYCNISMEMPERKDTSLDRYHATDVYEKKDQHDLYADANDYLWITLIVKEYRQPLSFEYKTKDFCCAKCAQKFLGAIRKRDTVIQERRKKYSRSMNHHSKGVTNV